MKYNELIQLYFERSNALQAYWTLYVVVIGGLLAFSSLRKQPALVTTLLVTVLYCLFAWKNLEAIRDTTVQRHAALQAIKQTSPDAADVRQVRDLLEPTLNPPLYPGVRNFHMVSDLLVVAALWAMEGRRRRLQTTVNS